MLARVGDLQGVGDDGRGHRQVLALRLVVGVGVLP